VEGRADRGIIITTSLLLLFGLVMVYSASAPFSLRHFGSDTHMLLRQLMAAGVGIVLLLILARFDYRRFRNLDDVCLIGTVLLTILTVLPIPRLSDGRWLHLGPLALQPTELLKLSLIVYLAASMERRGARIRSFVGGVLPYAVILLVIALILINQPDLGMTLLLTVLTLTMLFLGGARIAHLGFLLASALPFVYLAIRLAPYRLSRILAFLDPQAYSCSSGYQVIQSLVAIGSGGILGRGLGASRAKLFYLPQAHSDFIFSVTAEETGLMGGVILLGLFAVLVRRAFAIAGRAPDRLGRLLALGIGFSLGFQTLLNLGVTLGALPVTGLTLPFISNGGSSLMVSLAMVGILLSISRHGGSECAF